MGKTNDQKPMTRTQMLTSIMEFKDRLGREVNVSDFPPHLQEQMARLFGSPNNALEMAYKANITPAALDAYRRQNAADIEHYIGWNVAGAIGMPNDLRIKEFGGPPSMRQGQMPTERKEIAEMARSHRIGRKLLDK
jgi:hypothetical protein